MFKIIEQVDPAETRQPEVPRYDHERSDGDPQAIGPHGRVAGKLEYKINTHDDGHLDGIAHIHGADVISGFREKVESTDGAHFVHLGEPGTEGAVDEELAFLATWALVVEDAIEFGSFGEHDLNDFTIITRNAVREKGTKEGLSGTKGGFWSDLREGGGLKINETRVLCSGWVAAGGGLRTGLPARSL